MASPGNGASRPPPPAFSSIPKFSAPPAAKPDPAAEPAPAAETPAAPNADQGDRAMPAPAVPKFPAAASLDAAKEAARRAASAAAGSADVQTAMEPEPVPATPVPPPEPTPQPQISAQEAARKAAVSAAAAALQHAAPAQRERAIADAMKAAAGGSATGNAAVPSNRPKLTPSDKAPAVIEGNGYQVPDWAQAFPESDEVSVDIMKTGTIVESVPLREKSFFTFGRHPSTDCTVEHPSTSRLHAVMQFEGQQAYLVDCGSTHGSCLNKQPLDPLQYYPVPVGAQFKLGQSSRVYILNAPAEWLPLEGPNKAQRARLRQEEAARKITAKVTAQDRKAGESAMRRALRGEMTWGMGEDAEVDEMDDADIDWQRLYDGGMLNEKQQKTAERIRAKEWKIKNMTEESKRIRCKDNEQGGLSSGQAETLVRNEQGMDKLQEEIDDLVESLCETVRTSMKGKRDAKAKDAEADKPAKRRRADSDDSGSDSEDDFFDRTKQQARRGRGASGKDPAAAKQAAGLVHTAASLCVKLHEQCAERGALKPKLMQAEVEAMEGSADGATDALDAFMTDMKDSEAQARLQALQSAAALLDAQIEQTRHLLRIADPDGHFKEGSAAAAAAICASTTASDAAPAQPASTANAPSAAGQSASNSAAGTGSAHSSDPAHSPGATQPAAGGHVTGIKAGGDTNGMKAPLPRQQGAHAAAGAAGDTVGQGNAAGSRAAVGATLGKGAMGDGSNRESEAVAKSILHASQLDPETASREARMVAAEAKVKASLTLLNSAQHGYGMSDE